MAYDPVSYIESESARIAAIAGSGELTARVPGCPDWTLRDLIHHVGGVQNFWAHTVLAGGDRPDLGAAFDAIDGDPAQWYASRAASLVDTLRATPADAPSWTWWGEPRTVGAAARHQAQEASVHRWDAESAVGEPSPLPAEVAHDGVDEFLTVGLAADLGDAAPPAHVVFESTDTNGRWEVGTAALGEVAATVRATASDLVLFLYKRLPLSAVSITGSSGAVEATLAAADTE